MFWRHQRSQKGSKRCCRSKQCMYFLLLTHTSPEAQYTVLRLQRYVNERCHGESKGDHHTRLHLDGYVGIYRYTKNTSGTENAKSSFQSDDQYQHSANSKVFNHLCDTAKPSYRYVTSILTIVAGTEGKQFFPVTSYVVIKYYLLLYEQLASPTTSFSPKPAPKFILLFLPRTLQELIALQHCFSFKTVHQLRR